jgi:hypothetical protein
MIRLFCTAQHGGEKRISGPRDAIFKRHTRLTCATGKASHGQGVRSRRARARAPGRPQRRSRGESASA